MAGPLSDCHSGKVLLHFDLIFVGQTAQDNCQTPFRGRMTSTSTRSGKGRTLYWSTCCFIETNCPSPIFKLILKVQASVFFVVVVVFSITFGLQSVISSLLERDKCIHPLAIPCSGSSTCEERDIKKILSFHLARQQQVLHVLSLHAREAKDNTDASATKLTMWTMWKNTFLGLQYCQYKIILFALNVVQLMSVNNKYFLFLLLFNMD